MCPNECESQYGEPKGRAWPGCMVEEQASCNSHKPIPEMRGEGDGTAVTVRSLWDKCTRARTSGYRRMRAIFRESMPAVGSPSPVGTYVVAEIITFGKEVREGCKRHSSRIVLACRATYLYIGPPYSPRSGVHQSRSCS